MAAGRFREDLFYRLHVYPITVPPLRDRVEDIPALVTHFVRRLSEATGRPISEIPQSVIRALEAYPWPGNIRELENVLERAVILSEGPRLVLPDRYLGAKGSTPAQIEPPSVPGRYATLEAVERDHISAVLRSTGGKVAGQSGAATILELHPNTLRSRMKKLGIQP